MSIRSQRSNQELITKTGEDIYQHGNLHIANGRLRIDRQSLPLANILSVADRHIRRPRRHWMVILISSVAVLIIGYRLLPGWLAWTLMSAGVLLGAWCLIFHQDKQRIIRLHLLLNQRVSVLFPEPAEADGFLEALEKAKGGKLPVIRR